MGIDESMRKDMNQDLSAIPPLMSLPGLGGSTNTQDDQGRRQGRQQPKRNQRQFERIWKGNTQDILVKIILL
jgi:hypothetical protein